MLFSTLQGIFKSIWEAECKVVDLGRNTYDFDFQEHPMSIK